jgi:O-antigen ligase
MKETAGVQATAHSLGRWSAIAMGFTLPIWTLADSLLMGLLALSWAASGQWRGKWQMVRSNPVALSALMLFAFLLLGTLWGEGSLEDRALYLKKYGELLFIPLLMTLALTAQDRRRALWGFACGLLLTLGLSYALWLGWFTPGGLIKGDPSNPFVFKRHITHNILMAFGALLFATFAWRSKDARWRWSWSALALCAAANVLLMVQGRTGYLILAALTMLLLHLLWGWRGIAAAVVLLSGAFAGAYAVSSSFHDRLDLAVNNARNWNPDVSATEAISERLEFYQNTLEIIREHPVTGVGTGGFGQAYAEHVAPKGLKPTRNPHNQYLLVMAQVGVIGLALLCWLFIRQWRAAEGLPEPGYRLLGRGLVLTIVIGCVFNALLIDHTEKLLYCWFTGLFFAEAQQRAEV